MSLSRTASSGTAGGAPRLLSTDTPGKFFAARAAYRAAYIRDTETQEQKLARLSREKHAAQFLISQRGVDKIFEWEFDYERMWWTRVQVSRKEREERWAEFDSKCKRYDPITKEWDLAWFLDYTGPRLSAGQGIDEIMEEEEEETECHRPNPFFRESDNQLDPPAPHYHLNPSSDNESFEVEDGEESHGITTPSSSMTATPILSASPIATSSTARPPATTTIRPPIATTTWLPAAGTSWIPTTSAAWMPIATTAPTTSRTDSSTLADLQEDGEITANGEWHPRFPTLIATLMSRHLFRWGTSDLPPVSKHLTLSEACKAVGFPPTPEIKSVLDTESSERSAAFAHWVSCMVLDIPLPVDWWLLAPKSPIKLRDLLRTTDIRIFHSDDPYQRLRLWCLDDRQNARHMRTWFVAVENPSTALAMGMSARSVDEAVRWMLISGKREHNVLYN